MERQRMPDYQPIVVVPELRHDDGAQQLFLDAGRVLMLWAWGALIAAASAAGWKNDDDDGRLEHDTSSAVHALLALVLWNLGVCLVALVHLERRRFLLAARVAAAVANVVLDCFFVRPWLWN